MTHVAYESKLRSVIRSSIHQCQGNWLAIGHTVVYYARAAHTFSARIKCRHCTFSREDIYDPCRGTVWQLGERFCIMPGLRIYLVQELNVSTVLGTFLHAPIGTRTSDLGISILVTFPVIVRLSRDLPVVRGGGKTKYPEKATT